MAMLRIITFSIPLTRSPKPVKTTLELAPRMEVLDPTLTCFAACVIGADTTTTFLAVPATAAVNCA